MPLCNNLYNLVGRDQVGWCLYGLVMACIIFNILILLLRSCAIFCEYVRARSELLKRLYSVRVPGNEDSPFKPVTKPSVFDEPTKVYPTARDFVSFGMRQDVTNSI